MRKLITFTKGSLLTAFFVFCPLRLYSAQAAQDPAGLSKKESKTHSQELFISPDAVFEMRQKGEKIIFIDVRLKAEFDKFRISGSMNVPLHTIKVKAFLKPYRLILVNEGYSYYQLEQECLNLKNAGFSVWILQGGLSFWQQKGNALEGDVLAQKGLNQMPPEALFAEKDYEDWFIIDISEPYNPDMSGLIPQTAHIPFSNNNARQFISGVKREIGKREKKGFFPVLILNKNGDEYEKIQDIFKNTEMKSVFYLKGGIEGYKLFIKNMTVQPQIKYSVTSMGPDDEKTAIKPCSSCR